MRINPEDKGLRGFSFLRCLHYNHNSAWILVICVMCLGKAAKYCAFLHYFVTKDLHR